MFYDLDEDEQDADGRTPLLLSHAPGSDDTMHLADKALAYDDCCASNLVVQGVPGEEYCCGRKPQ
eukprot:3356760-Karenia_brevis.AAC.1